MDMLKKFAGGGGSEEGPSDDKIAETAAKVFKSLDKDNSGGLDKAELGPALNQIMTKLGLKPADEGLLSKVIGFMDSSKDGKVSLEEFTDLARKLAKFLPKQDHGAGHEATAGAS
mmetsp:Transcript_2600/g.4549  ORF Transcript_2600/g.4549 Transcript_2600/m.4549 type:complete len:115 (+) Transcript_2600:163-507(+)